MASTMQVLLKALGINIDPDEIMRVALEAKRIVDEFNARLAAIEASQQRIITLLESGHERHGRNRGNGRIDHQPSNSFDSPGTGITLAPGNGVVGNGNAGSGGGLGPDTA